ncbi:hypothetical protein CEXT_577371 [Caerostris extrusa]|uniref:Uncharacterized protein n=1 Tax=Caerostris extrusa TaxID=172846 RepID=A0AAV4RF98_CAEEX|nr:hypothetical protein CEXT_577371 [Caerostris extrusa]
MDWNIPVPMVPFLVPVLFHGYNESSVCQTTLNRDGMTVGRIGTFQSFLSKATMRLFEFTQPIKTSISLKCTKIERSTTLKVENCDIMTQIFSCAHDLRIPLGPVAK